MMLTPIGAICPNLTIEPDAGATTPASGLIVSDSNNNPPTPVDPPASSGKMDDLLTALDMGHRGHYYAHAGIVTYGENVLLAGQVIPFASKGQLNNGGFQQPRFTQIRVLMDQDNEYGVGRPVWDTLLRAPGQRRMDGSSQYKSYLANSIVGFMESGSPASCTEFGLARKMESFGQWGDYQEHSVEQVQEIMPKWYVRLTSHPNPASLEFAHEMCIPGKGRGWFVELQHMSPIVGSATDYDAAELLEFRRSLWNFTQLLDVYVGHSGFGPTGWKHNVPTVLAKGDPYVDLIQNKVALHSIGSHIADMGIRNSEFFIPRPEAVSRKNGSREYVQSVEAKFVGHMEHVLGFAQRNKVCRALGQVPPESVPVQFSVGM